MKTRNKILIIAIILFVVVIIVSLVVQSLAKTRNQLNLNEGLNKTAGNIFTTDNSAHVNLILSQQISLPSFSVDQTQLFYVSPDSNSLFQYDLSTQKNLNITPLIKFDPIISAVWSPDKKNVFISTQKTGEVVKNFLVNLDSKNESALPDTFQNGIWKDNENLVVYNFELNSINSIIDYNISNKLSENIIQFQDVSKEYSIELLGIEQNKINYLISTDSALGTRSFYQVDLSTQQNIQILDNVIEAKTNEDSIIAQRYLDGKRKFFVYDLNGQNAVELNFDIISISNILKKEKNLYWIKVQDNGVATGNLGLSYQFILTVNLDNLDNNNSSELLNIGQEGSYSSAQLFLSADQTKIYFINAANNFLYSINLK